MIFFSQKEQKYFPSFTNQFWDFPWWFSKADSVLMLRGVWVQLLVGEGATLGRGRYHMPQHMWPKIKTKIKSHARVCFVS